MDAIYKQLAQVEEKLKGMDMHEIDPVEFGALKADVSTLKYQVNSIAGKVDSLLEMANKGRGGLVMFNTGLVAAGGLLAWITEHFLLKKP